MKIIDIFNIEHNNDSQILLFKEGLFFRAYERSALRFIEKVADFHVLKRTYKVINNEMVFVGFPAANLERLLQGKGLAAPVVVPFGVALNGFTENRDFVKWKDSIPDSSKQEDEQRLLIQERVLPNFKDNHPLHVYKSGYDVLVQVYRLVQNFSREHKYTIGEELKRDAFQLALYTYRYAQGKNAKELEQSELSYPLLALSQIDVIRLRLRILSDLHKLSPNSFSRINTDLEYLKDQLSSIKVTR